MIVVVGGNSRNVGKTSVVAGIISAMPEMNWLAVKITQYGHGICSTNGEACDCATADHVAAITEERDRIGQSDTSRFLNAGASKVLWVRTRQGYLAEAMPRLREDLSRFQNIIIESNSVMKFIRPDVYLVVLDPAKDDFKESAKSFLDRADAALIHSSSGINWRGISLKPISNKPQFVIGPPTYLSEDVIQFIRTRSETPKI